MADIDSVSAAAMECWDRISRQDASWLPEPALDWLIDRTGWDLRRAVREVGEAAEADFRVRLYNLRTVRRGLQAARSLLLTAAGHLPTAPAAARQTAREGLYSAVTARVEPVSDEDRVALRRVAGGIIAAANLLDRLRAAVS